MQEDKTNQGTTENEKSVSNIPLGFRSHTDEDIPFILDSWGTSYYVGSNLKGITPQQFNFFHRGIRERLVKSGIITIAHPVNDPWHILGWICHYSLILNTPIVHYVYVKAAVKRNGIGLSLINKIAPVELPLVIYTHYTHTSGDIMGARFEKWKYMPHLI